MSGGADALAGEMWVKATTANPGGKARPGPRPASQQPDRHVVVGAHDRVGQLPAVSGEQVVPSLLAAADAKGAVRGADETTVRIAAQGVVEAEPPLDGVGRVRWPVEVEQPPLAVSGDQVRA